MTGRFIAIVGPSGVGKDSVLMALAARDPRRVLARRVITRRDDAGGEDFEPVTEAEFAARRDAGAFALHWQAHRLSYGIPVQVDALLARGRDVLANLSRAVLPQAMARFARCEVIELTAQRDVLAARLAGRGRETVTEIAARLDRSTFAVPIGIAPRIFDNSGELDDCVTAILAHLDPARVP